MFAIKTYTIGVGKEGPPPPLLDMAFGKSYLDQWGGFDEETLQELAEVTGGAYFRADNTRALEEIYVQIDTLEKTILIKEPLE